MLQDVQDVASRVGTLLDDPTLSQYTLDYQMPFIDQQYDEMDVELERAGMQYVEGTVSFDIPVGTTDLSPYLINGQPLQYMKFGKRIDWKLPGQPDVMYRTSALVQELDYVQISNIGAREWTQKDGALQVTPSNSPITLNVYFDTLSTNILDPDQNVIRGTAHILAYRVAAQIVQIRGDLTGKRGPYLEKKANDSWGNFLQVLVMNKQKKNVHARPIHRRRRLGSFYVQAPPDTGDGDLS